MAKGRNKNGTFAKGNKCAEKWTEAEAIKLGDELLEWMGRSETNILFEKFFVIEKKLYANVHNRLAERYERFARLIDTAKKIQELRISMGCLTNEYNGGFGKFFLSANHSMSEKSITSLENGEDTEQDINITVNIVDDNRDKVEINRQGTDK